MSSGTMHDVTVFRFLLIKTGYSETSALVSLVRDVQQIYRELVENPDPEVIIRRITSFDLRHDFHLAITMFGKNDESVDAIADRILAIDRENLAGTTLDVLGRSLAEGQWPEIASKQQYDDPFEGPGNGGDNNWG